MVWVLLVPARMTTPPAVDTPTAVAVHDAPSIVADIERAPVVLVGPVVVLLSLMLPHAAETNSTDTANNRRRFIDRSK